MREIESLRAENKKKELDNLKRAMKENKFCNDTPEDSDIYQMRVREGDLLILATDGVFDNLFQEEILGIVKDFTLTNLKNKHTAISLARLMVEAASMRSKQNNIKTPFSVKKANLIVEHRKSQ